jgi:hypothetical protein
MRTEMTPSSLTNAHRTLARRCTSVSALARSLARLSSVLFLVLLFIVVVTGITPATRSG